jgi:hypothetical protein
MYTVYVYRYIHVSIYVYKLYICIYKELSWGAGLLWCPGCQGAPVRSPKLSSYQDCYDPQTAMFLKAFWLPAVVAVLRALTVGEHVGVPMPKVYHVTPRD